MHRAVHLALAGVRRHRDRPRRDGERHTVGDGQHVVAAEGQRALSEAIDLSLFD